jgi:light-regulated signal transduction histidine kinase (bacteriophytochrome)
VLRKTRELTAAHKDGHEFPIEIGIFRIKEDNNYMFCTFVRDITERRVASESLERAVQERTTELIVSNEQLKQFAKIASHDLQEPLCAVQGFVKLLADNLEKAGSKEGDSAMDRARMNADNKEFLAFILDGTQRMQTLIESVLLHSSIKPEDSDDVATDCNSVIEEVLVNLDASIKKNDVHVEVYELPTVAVERSQLVQLFQNLLSNAIKYRKEETPVIVISAERTVDDWLFSVRDNGIGIDSQYTEKIFDMFARLHGRTKYAGTGMGLAICKKIVNTHNGRIWVESELGQGSIFMFTLPAAKFSKENNDGQLD